MSNTTVPGRVAQASDELSILPADTGRARSAFLRFPYQLYRSDPNWVPPLRSDARKQISRRNPFFAHAEVGLFIARRGSRTVGRIAAVHDWEPAGSDGVGDGRFGLFDCSADHAAAAALAESAAAWLRKRGLTSMTGPFNFTINDECGTLIEGFEQPPTVMTAYNPPYYAELLDSCGFVKETDLWSWERDCAQAVPERLVRLAKRVESDGHVRVRPMDLGDFRVEAERFRRLYNHAMSANHGFHPLSAGEFGHLADRIKPWIDPGLAQVAEKDGHMVGASLALPDLNQALATAGGRLTPLGLLRVRRAARSIDRVRYMVLMVAEQERMRGVDALLLRRVLETAKNSGYRSIEASWVQEDNHLVNRFVSAMDSRRTKVHRIWRREL